MIGAEYTAQLKELKVESFLISSMKALQNFLDNPEKVDIGVVSSVVWVAGKSLPTNTHSKFDLAYIQDYRSLNLFIDFLSKREWRGRFIFLSSGGCVYKESSNPLTENSVLSPNNTYGKLKLEQEKLIQASTLSFSILRVSNVFGLRKIVTPGQDVINNWIHSYKRREKCKVFGNLRTFRDYINVSDVVKAIILAAESLDKNYILNVGSGEKTSIEDLVEILSRCTAERIQFDFQNAREFDRNGYVLDITKAKTLLNWYPERSRKNNISDFISEQISI